MKVCLSESEMVENYCSPITGKIGLNFFHIPLKTFLRGIGNFQSSKTWDKIMQKIH